MERFGARVLRAVDARGPLCVGVDPHPALLAEWGLGDDVDGLERFSARVVEAVGERVAVVKPQSAFYERHGSRGVFILESTIRQFHEAGALVLLDVKRGDIGSTASAYASAYLDPAAPLAVDAITVSPYLGVGALRPMLDAALFGGRGVFVLALTSNPEGGFVQRARTADGRTVAQAIVDEISQVNAGVEPLGDIGAVIGATVGEGAIDIKSINGPVLMPGLGEQGGRPEDLLKVLGTRPPVVLPSYSRQVLRAGPSAAGLRAAVERAADRCTRALTVATGLPCLETPAGLVAETAPDR